MLPNPAHGLAAGEEQRKLLAGAHEGLPVAAVGWCWLVLAGEHRAGISSFLLF